MSHKVKMMELLMKHFQTVSEPYEFEKENTATGEVEVVKKLTDNINEDRALSRFVKNFVNQNKGAED